MTKITKDKWIFMPHPAHFILARDCKFFLATKIGKYIVSTVGEYWPDYRVRKIYEQTRGIKVEGMGDEYDRNYRKTYGYEDLSIGGYKYETMVFLAKKTQGKNKCEACPYVIDSGHNLDMDRYKTPKEAFKGHYKMCNKYAKK